MDSRRFATTWKPLKVWKPWTEQQLKAAQWMGPGGSHVENPDLSPVEPDGDRGWELIHVTVGDGRITWTWQAFFCAVKDDDGPCDELLPCPRHSKAARAWRKTSGNAS